MIPVMRLGIVAVCAVVLLVGCSKKSPSAAPGADQASGPVVVLDDTNFDEQIASGVVLVDFWATWCGPCRIQGPIVDKVAEQVLGQAKVAKLDVDVAQEASTRAGIRNIPTLILYKDGKPVQQFVGVTKAEELVAAITKATAAP